MLPISKTKGDSKMLWDKDEVQVCPLPPPRGVVEYIDFKYGAEYKRKMRRKKLERIFGDEANEDN